MIQTPTYKLLLRFFEIIAWIIFCAIPPLLIMPFQHHHEPMHQGGWWMHFIFLFIIKNIKFILFYYTHTWWLIPSFFEKNKFKTYCIWLVILFIAVVSVPYIAELLFHGHGPNHHHHAAFATIREGHVEHHHKKGPSIDAGIHFFMSIIVMLLPLLIHVYKRWLSIDKEKKEIELTFLKSQINHHFLFNSLNSIYSLSVQESKKTPAAVHSLSAIMRYILDETIKEKVDLKREVDYINHYISLQKIRLNSMVQVHYTVAGDVAQQQIAPMLLIPFIENCFKHGVSTVHEGKIEIAITITASGVFLHTCNNQFDDLIHDHQKSGIGIPNVLKRLQHEYPNRYTYNQFNQAGNYCVDLNIELL